MKNLTKLQESFALHYSGSKNGTRAYIAAGGGEKGAAQAASRMLTLPKVKARVADHVEGTLRKVELDNEMILLELMRIAFGDIRDTVSWDGETSFELLPSRGLTKDAAHTIKKVKWKQERQWRGRGEDAELWEVVNSEVEYADRLGALKLLMEYTGMTRDPASKEPDGSPQTFAGHPINVVVQQLTQHFSLTELKKLDTMLEQGQGLPIIEHREESNGSTPNP